ncbi:MAG: Hsp20/alpha crystallin family protein [Gammaproteobacteria bacterium]|nr:Hsp20/alpha crystallin family protein [Gammaproteobacteria bacterium]
MSERWFRLSLKAGGAMAKMTRRAKKAARGVEANSDGALDRERAELKASRRGRSTPRPTPGNAALEKPGPIVWALSKAVVETHPRTIVVRMPMPEHGPDRLKVRVVGRMLAVELDMAEPGDEHDAGVPAVIRNREPKPVNVLRRTIHIHADVLDEPIRVTTSDGYVTIELTRPTRLSVTPQPGGQKLDERGELTVVGD